MSSDNAVHLNCIWFLVTMPLFASLKWPSHLIFAGEIPPVFEALASAYHHLSTFFRLMSGGSILSFLMYSAGTFLAITLPAWMIFLSSRRNKRINNPFVPTANSVNAASAERRVGPIVYEAHTVGIIRDVVVTTADVAYEDALTIDDADYAEELQFQETLLASLLTSESANSSSSSTKEPIENAELSTKSFCGICLENKESWLMFANDTCRHSFCYDCTKSHIEAKIHDKVKDIACPAPSCNAALDFDACRLMIPDDALVEWDELLCVSLIPESQKLYCPFRDCSALLVNDFEGVVEKTRCVACNRWFCAACRVPWHTEFKCREFQKLYAKKGGKMDKIVKELAKKKSWQKCPKCKMYVEKSEGCIHITCRCKYEFCYRCGSKWSDSHGSCRRKS